MSLAAATWHADVVLLADGILSVRSHGLVFDGTWD